MEAQSSTLSIRNVLSGVIALIGLALSATGCGGGDDSPESSPTPAELRVVWAGTASDVAQPIRVFLVEPADGIAARGIVRDLSNRTEVFIHRERSFYGGYILDVRTHPNPADSICGRDIRGRSGEALTATIRTTPHACRIQISRA
jgi:hypothetical protein